MRVRLLVLVLGAGLLLGGTPALASPTTTQAREREAQDLLRAATRAGRDLTYTGTQVVATWRGPDSGSARAQVHHDPVAGSTLDTDAPLAATAALDPRLLALLAAAYDLQVSGPGRCTGRAARVVTASRPDGTVAGRFWLDQRSGLLLRREVFDATGERLRSSEFVDLAVSAAGAAGPGPLAGGAVALPQASALRALREDGWRVPRTLPGGFRLFDTALATPRPGKHVLHLAYSDGLSTVSLFAQRGRLGTAPVAGFTAETVGARPVWMRHEAPERVVWAGGGQVWTLVSDAPPATVRDAVASLPGDAAPHDGVGDGMGERVRARLARGLGRLGGMLNPFR